MSHKKEFGRVELPLVDRVQFGSMQCALGGDFDLVICEFFADCETFSKRLSDMALAADTVGFCDLCHEIKGASAILGLTQIAGSVAHWEVLATDGWLPAAEEVSREFESFVEATRLSLAGES